MNLEIGKMYKYSNVQNNISIKLIFYFVPTKRIGENSYLCHIYKDLDDSKWNNCTKKFNFSDCYHHISKVNEELSMAIAL